MEEDDRTPGLWYTKQQPGVKLPQHIGEYEDGGAAPSRTSGVDDWGSQNRGTDESMPFWTCFPGGRIRCPAHGYRQDDGPDCLHVPRSQEHLAEHTAWAECMSAVWLLFLQAKEDLWKRTSGMANDPVNPAETSDVSLYIFQKGDCSAAPSHRRLDRGRRYRGPSRLTWPYYFQALH